MRNRMTRKPPTAPSVMPATAPGSGDESSDPYNAGIVPGGVVVACRAAMAVGGEGVEGEGNGQGVRPTRATGAMLSRCAMDPMPREIRTRLPPTYLVIERMRA